MAKKASKAVAAVPVDDWEWKVRSAADTIQQAEDIRADKKLYDAAVRELQDRRKALDAVLSRAGAVRKLAREPGGKS